MLFERDSSNRKGREESLKDLRNAVAWIVENDIELNIPLKEVTLARFSVKGSRTVRIRASVLSGRNDRGRNFTTGSINIVVTRVAALSGRPGTVRSLDFNFNLKSLRPTRKDHLRSVRRSVSLEPERGEKRRIAAASSLGLFVRTRPTA